MVTLADRKALLRRTCLARREALSPDVRSSAAAAIAAEAIGSPLWDEHRPGPVAGYWPILSEADPGPLLAALAGTGWALCLPIVAEPTLLFRAYAPGDPLHPAGFGTRGPSVEALAVEPRVLLVPCVGFDRSGTRLGYGAGHYDRALARLEQAGPVIAIGIAFSVQEVDSLPAEAHDRPLDAIVTEREWVVPRP